LRKIKKISKEAINRIKSRFKPIAILQFGSSLHPKDMMVESDIDFLVVLRRKLKEPLEVFLFDSIEVAAHLLSKREFLEGVETGFPIVIMALKFGKVIYDPKGILKKFRRIALPTERTAEIWYENGWTVFSRAILEYISRGCVGCYLKDCHHSARSFLRSFLLKTKGILCERDKEILLNIPKEIRKFYKRIIEARREGENFPFKPKFKIKAREIFRDSEAKPLLHLEKIVQYVIGEIEGKKMRSLREVVKGIKGEVSSIYLDKSGKVTILQNKKFLTRKLF
jgi:predicted nucleotidyltransferase